MKLLENKAMKSKALKWLASHFKPEQVFVLGDSWFGIFPQSKNTYAIKCVKISECEFAPDEGEWLSWPETRYETLGGAYYAILLNYQNFGPVRVKAKSK